MTDSPTTLLRLPEVMKRTGLSRSVVYDLCKRGAFPAPCKLTERSSAWVDAEVSDWVASRIAASRKAA